MIDPSSFLPQSTYPTELPATQRELEEVLQWITNESEKWENNDYFIPPKTHKRVLEFVRDQFLVVREELRRAVQRGKSVFSLLIDARRAIAEIKEKATSMLVAPKNEQSALINKEIEDLTPATTSNVNFSFPPQRDLQDCINQHLPEGMQPYLQEKKIPEKVAALFEQTRQNQEDLEIGVHQVLEEESFAPSARIPTAMILGEALQECARPDRSSKLEKMVRKSAVSAVKKMAGKNPARMMEFVVNSSEPPEDSLNPGRDSILSTAVKMASQGVSEVVLKRHPVIAGINKLVEKPKDVQRILADFIEKHPEEEFAPMFFPNAEGINPNHAAQAAYVVLEAVQIPLRAIEGLEAPAVKTLGRVLDACGITDANIERAARRVRENLENNNLQLPSQFP